MVGGLANGCVYGLIALGFVLIYKATEQVNFAQGDMMMLGAFIAIGLGNESHGGLSFWLACAGAILIMAAFGMAVERTLLRPLFGQSQISVVILTIAFGFVLRFITGASGATIHWSWTIRSRAPTSRSVGLCSARIKSPSSS